MPITVTNLTCVYGAGTPFETTALRDVSVTVENGSFVGILGRTGCGKSTLIQIMAGLLTPTAGTVMLDGQDIHARRYDRSILRRKVGIVFQYPECQLFETTVEKDVAFGLKHSGLSAAEKERILASEGERLLGKTDERDHVTVLCIEGKKLTSEAFAAHINAAMLAGKSRMVFIIGGSFGLHPSVKRRADMLLSFSDMTFPHRLFRVMLAEQIYRAFKINNNEPYHK